MDKTLSKKLMGLVDARSARGTMARGTNIYKGIGSSPNPQGNNQMGAAKNLLERRKKNGRGLTL